MNSPIWYTNGITSTCHRQTAKESAKEPDYRRFKICSARDGGQSRCKLPRPVFRGPLCVELGQHGLDTPIADFSPLAAAGIDLSSGRKSLKY